MKNYLYNMFANIKNGQVAKRSYVFQKRKRICESLLKVLWKEGFILGYKTNQTNDDQIKIFLKYRNRTPVINSIKPISKPGRRVYYTIKQIWKIESNKCFILFSTNQGIKSITECKKLKIGGEPIISIN